MTIYIAIVLMILAVILLRSVKKDGLSAPAIKARKWAAIALGVGAVGFAIYAAVDDGAQGDVITLTGDRLG